jgi:predicted transcriptional regulator YheO
VLCKNYNINQIVKAKRWVKRISLSYAQDRVQSVIQEEVKPNCWTHELNKHYNTTTWQNQEEKYVFGSYKNKKQSFISRVRERHWTNKILGFL